MASYVLKFSDYKGQQLTCQSHEVFQNSIFTDNFKIKVFYKKTLTNYNKEILLII